MTVGLVVLAVVLALVAGVCGVLAVRYRDVRRSVRRLDGAAGAATPAAAAQQHSVTGLARAREAPESRPLGPAGLSDAVDALGDRLRDLESAADARADWMGRLSEAIARMTEGVVICDADGAVVFREGSALAAITDRHGRALMDAALDRVLSRACEGMTAREEVRLYGPPQRVVVLNASPLAGGGLALVEDVTEPERVETLRRDFVSNIGHELRTPVGAISLLAETLVDLLSDCEGPDGEARFGTEERATMVGLAGRLVAEAERMTRAIDDLAELSSVERETDGERSVVALQDVVSAVVERLANAAEQYRIAVNVAAPDDPILVHADRRQIASAVHNLLDNALKYSPEGASVSVRIRRWGRSAELSVQDTGIGIPQGDLPRIFERFYRVDRSRTSSSGGIGLGLAIVRHVAINHGGDVEVESMEGEGSTFTLRLPMLAGAEGDEPQGSAGEGSLPDEPAVTLPGPVSEGSRRPA
ncbi:MAG: two-component sensor histidine kinase [Chloroflexi bacterium]|nr:two-component sensor histidine kinase [Chloroflexota bacterium]